MNITTVPPKNTFRITFTCKDLTGDEILEAEIEEDTLTDAWSSVDIKSLQDSYAKDMRKATLRGMTEEFTHDINIWEDDTKADELRISLYKLIEDKNGTVMTDSEHFYRCELLSIQVIPPATL
jgi:hypothetical protein